MLPICWTIGKSEFASIEIGRFSNPSFFALLIIVCRRFAASTKRRGDRGSPYLSPLLQWKVFPGTPLRSTEEVPEFSMSWIHPTHLVPKPLCRRIWSIAGCSIMSKAFSKSSLRMINFFLEVLQMCKYSKAQTRQSWIVLVLIKPYWFLCTNLMMTFCNLSARILVISLMEQFKSEMGLNSPTKIGQSFLGIKVMYDPLMLWRHISLSKKPAHNS